MVYPAIPFLSTQKGWGARHIEERVSDVCDTNRLLKKMHAV